MARKRKRRSVARKSVRRRRRNPGAFLANPRKRRRASARRTVRRGRRRSYSRNPGLVGEVKSAVMGGALVLGGRAGYASANKLIPSFGSVPLDLLKGLGVVVGLSMLARKAVGNDKAKLVAAGAASSFVAAIVAAYAPSMASYLGDGYGVGSYGPSFGGTPGRVSVGSFPGGGFGEGDASGIGSYVGGGWGG